MERPAEDMLERIALLAATADEDDLTQLVELYEEINTLVSDLTSSGNKTASASAVEAGSLVESIIMRSSEDPAASLDAARTHLAALQANMTAGPDVRATQSEQQTHPESADTADDSIVDEWVESTRDHLTEIEQAALKLEKGDSTESVLKDIKRRLHTIKGECGVLSLERAQTVCHDVETTLAKESPGYPTGAACATLLFAFLDWMRAYAEALKENPSAQPPADFPPPADPAERQATNAETLTQPTQRAAGQSIDKPANGEQSQSETLPVPNNTPVDVLGPDGAADGMAEFVAEAREHLSNAEQEALVLENDPTDLESLNTVFRAFHTIKGVAGFMRLTPIVRLAHSAETLLDLARSGTLTLDTPRVDLVLQTCDLLGCMLAAIEGDPPPTNARLDELLEILERSTDPSAQLPTSEPHQGATRMADPGLRPTTEAAHESPQARAVSNATPEKKTNSPKATTRSTPAAQSVKVSSSRVDHLMDMVGELVIAHQMVVQDQCIQEIKSQRTHRNLAHSRKIVRDLQEVAMSLRMVTVKGTFQKMARLVRDTARKNSKSINFAMEGEDTEVDRTVVEEIADPLVHMVRNSCDHGIETPEERVSAGKAHAGTLTLRAYHRGGSIVVEVADNGRGLNRDKILAKAIERGIVPADRKPEEIPDAEVFGMVFQAGFSTADKVTDISGRGVGMDVVRRNIENLRGKIEIESETGAGAVFRLCLPLTMAIIDGMIVRAGIHRYVIPALSLEQSFRPQPGQVTSVAGGTGEMVTVRGTLLPIYRLGKTLGVECENARTEDSLLVVLETNGSRFALLVDDVVGQQQVVIKSLGDEVGQVRGVSGGAILGDGKVALILDIAGVLAQATHADPHLHGAHHGS